jgi:hypothetical protein
VIPLRDNEQSVCGPESRTNPPVAGRRLTWMDFVDALNDEAVRGR